MHSLLLATRHEVTIVTYPTLSSSANVCLCVFYKQTATRDTLCSALRQVHIINAASLLYCSLFLSLCLHICLFYTSYYTSYYFPPLLSPPVSSLISFHVSIPSIYFVRQASSLFFHRIVKNSASIFLVSSIILNISLVVFISDHFVLSILRQMDFEDASHFAISHLHDTTVSYPWLNCAFVKCDIVYAMSSSSSPYSCFRLYWCIVFFARPTLLLPLGLYKVSILGNVFPCIFPCTSSAYFCLRIPFHLSSSLF